MADPLVYTQIVHWNTLNDTLECLESLTHQTYPNHKIIVIDNASTDGGAEIIEQQYPEVILLRNPRNLGATGGYNTGLRYALENRADYVFVLNNDTFLSPDVVQLLVKACEPSDVGMVSPIIYYASEPDLVWSDGGGISPLTLDLVDKPRHGDVDKDNNDRDFLNACAILVKRPMLENVGFFDELFFLYYDDMDFSLRARKAGFRLLLVPEAKVWHKVSATSGGKDSPRERYFMACSSVLYFRKHAQFWQWIFIIPWRIGSACKTLIRLLVNRKPQSAKGYLRGLMAGLKYDLKSGNAYPLP